MLLLSVDFCFPKIQLRHTIRLSNSLDPGQVRRVPDLSGAGSKWPKDIHCVIRVFSVHRRHLYIFPQPSSYTCMHFYHVWIQKTMGQDPALTVSTLSMLGKFSGFFPPADFFFQNLLPKNSSRNTIRLSNGLDPDED